MPHKEKDANRAYMREYMRRRRAAVRPGVKPDAVKPDVKPDSAEVARLTAELAQARARIAELQHQTDVLPQSETAADLPPGDIVAQTSALISEVQAFYLRFQNLFGPKFKAWRSLDPPKRARSDMDAFLLLAADSLWECSPSVQDRLAKRKAVIAELRDQLDADIAELKSSRADENHEWLAECIARWPAETRRFVAQKLMEGLDPGEQQFLIIQMIRALPDLEQRIALHTRLAKVPRKYLAAEVLVRARGSVQSM
jgi:hypothetical protein